MQLPAYCGDRTRSRKDVLCIFSSWLVGSRWQQIAALRSSPQWVLAFFVMSAKDSLKGDSRILETKDGRSLKISKKDASKLTTWHGVMFGLGALLILGTTLLVYLLGGEERVHLSCLWSIFGSGDDVGSLLIVQHNCLAPYVLALVSVSIFILGYPLALLTFKKNAYRRELSDGHYNNMFRWIARGAAYPGLTLVAFVSSGLSSFAVVVFVSLIVISVELMRNIAEMYTTYEVYKDNNFAKIKNKRRAILMISTGLAIFLTMLQLISWIGFLIFNVEAQGLLTYVYAPVFLLYYGGYTIWLHMHMSSETVPLYSRKNLETYWDVADFVFMLVALGLVALGVLVAV